MAKSLDQIREEEAKERASASINQGRAGTNTANTNIFSRFVPTRPSINPTLASNIRKVSDIAKKLSLNFAENRRIKEEFQRPDLQVSQINDFKVNYEKYVIPLNYEKNLETFDSKLVDMLSKYFDGQILTEAMRLLSNLFAEEVKWELKSTDVQLPKKGFINFEGKEVGIENIERYGCNKMLDFRKNVVGKYIDSTIKRMEVVILTLLVNQVDAIDEFTRFKLPAMKLNKLKDNPELHAEGKKLVSDFKEFSNRALQIKGLQDFIQSDSARKSASFNLENQMEIEESPENNGEARSINVGNNVPKGYENLCRYLTVKDESLVEQASIEAGKAFNDMASISLEYEDLKERLNDFITERDEFLQPKKVPENDLNTNSSNSEVPNTSLNLLQLEETQIPLLTATNLMEEENEITMNNIQDRSVNITEGNLGQTR
jgi:hypothetical protein